MSHNEELILKGFNLRHSALLGRTRQSRSNGMRMDESLANASAIAATPRFEIAAVDMIDDFPEIRYFAPRHPGTADA
jgi:hypothetical protein